MSHVAPHHDHDDLDDQDDQEDLSPQTSGQGILHTYVHFMGGNQVSRQLNLSRYLLEEHETRNSASCMHPFMMLDATMVMSSIMSEFIAAAATGPVHQMRDRAQGLSVQAGEVALPSQ